MAKIMLWQYRVCLGSTQGAIQRFRATTVREWCTRTFEEAQTVFLDESARLIDDPDHSTDEERFLLGYSLKVRCLIVSHCYREPDSVIRLMAAELGMAYQNLINLFLRDCAARKQRPVIQWSEEAPERPRKR